MRRWTGLLLVLASLVATGCRDDTVRVTFRPKVGQVFRYEVTVHSRSEVRIAGEDPQVHEDDIVLQSEHTVLAAGPNGVRVKVVLGDASGSVRTFVVRFDRAAQLESVESDDPIGAAQDANTFGISEIFPAAAGAPPERRLGPGERWAIDDRVAVPGSIGRARLTGTGRLVSLGVEDDADVAKLATTSRLQLASEQQTKDGEEVRIDGEQVTEQHASHDLRDGAVRSASSRTTGRFSLEISPPVGQLRAPVHGTLTVTVSSSTKRLR
jgi:hypothetical protein